LAYEWNATAGALTFHFVGPAFAADVRFQTYGAGAPLLDVSFSMPSAPMTPGILFTSLQSASNLLLARGDIAAAHTPLLPGATLLPSFFQVRVSAVFSYPGGGTFTSWTQADLANSTLIQYDLEGPDVIVPHSIRYTPAGAPYAVDDWVLQVFHPVNVTTNCSVSGGGDSGMRAPKQWAAAEGPPLRRGRSRYSHAAPPLWDASGAAAGAGFGPCQLLAALRLHARSSGQLAVAVTRRFARCLCDRQRNAAGGPRC
jgi:hypothetical protein